MERCDLSDLPPDQCACVACRPDLVEVPPENITLVGQALWSEE